MGFCSATLGICFLLARCQRGSGCYGGLVGPRPGSAPDFPRPSPRLGWSRAWQRARLSTATFPTTPTPPTNSSPQLNYRFQLNCSPTANRLLSNRHPTALSSTAARPPTASFNTNSPTAFSAFQRGPLSGPGHSPLPSRRAGENPRSDRACIFCCCNNCHPCLRRTEGPAPTVISVFFSTWKLWR